MLYCNINVDSTKFSYYNMNCRIYNPKNKKDGINRLFYNLPFIILLSTIPSKTIPIIITPTTTTSILQPH